MGMVDLHRHDEYSTFDGFGKATELAKLAKKLGHTSLSTTNHGNTNGLVKHYKACQKEEIKCIMGVEGYFQPIHYADEERKEKARYHLCVFVKNLKGYENLNKLMFLGEKNKYYNPIFTFEDLKNCREGLICTSACVQGFLSQAICKDKIKVAEKALKRFVDIFGEDFYVEIQPYKISDKGLQEKVNVELMRLALKHNVKMILTSDSHYGRKEDFDTYLKMHEVAKHKYDIEATYKERYMPTKKEIMNRMLKMHERDLVNLGCEPRKFIKDMMKNLDEIEDKVEQNILDELEQELPQLIEGHDSFDILRKKVQEGLAERFDENTEKRDKKSEYVGRCKEELSIIKAHGISDYFLIVQDYTMFAKGKGIPVGPGRGSVCNCQVAWALGITDVDSLKFGLDFRRFLRKDKKKLPDIDLDFATNRRQEVIDYLVDKYEGRAAQICSYGLYKVDNLINDLAKVCGLDTTEKGLDDYEKKAMKEEIASIKKFILSECQYSDDTAQKNTTANASGELENLDYNRIKGTKECVYYDKKYDNIIKHFSKLYKKVRFIGTHAAGVAITSKSLLRYVGLRMVKDAKDKAVEKIYTNYDLADLDEVHVVKFDMLGLKTMESIGELRSLTGIEGVTPEMLEDDGIYGMLRGGETDGVFQFESGTAKSILEAIQTDCFEDVIAASSLNRPGPLQLKMPDAYANNKFNIEDAKKAAFYEYTKETYGTIIYQEQVQLMCVEIGKLTWAEADRVMKLMKNAIASMGELEKINQDKKELLEKFVKGAVENGYDEKVARGMFEKILVYTFNKGHSVGYSLISMEEAYHKLHNPIYFWYTKLKHTDSGKANKDKIRKFKEKAVANGAIIFLPHANYSADFSLRKVEGDRVIQEGLKSLKGVGEKAATQIESERIKNGVFTSYDNFYDRCKSRVVTTRVISIMKENGALEFDRKKYISRVTKYNSTLYAKSLQ